jgi:hypothetical protein
MIQFETFLQQNRFSKSLLSFYNFFPMILSMYLLDIYWVCWEKNNIYFFREVFTLGKLYLLGIKEKIK